MSKRFINGADITLKLDAGDIDSGTLSSDRLAVGDNWFFELGSSLAVTTTSVWVYVGNIADSFSAGTYLISYDIFFNNPTGSLIWATKVTHTGGTVDFEQTKTLSTTHIGQNNGYYGRVSKTAIVTFPAGITSVELRVQKNSAINSTVIGLDSYTGSLTGEAERASLTIVRLK